MENIERARELWEREAARAVEAWAFVLDTVIGVDEHGPASIGTPAQHDMIVEAEVEASISMDRCAVLTAMWKEA